MVKNIWIGSFTTTWLLLSISRFPEGCGHTNTNTHTHSIHSSNERLLFKYQPNVPQFLQPYNEIRETTSMFTCQKTEQGKTTNHSQYRQYSWQHHIVRLGGLNVETFLNTPIFKAFNVVHTQSFTSDRMYVASYSDTCFTQFHDLPESTKSSENKMKTY